MLLYEFLLMSWAPCMLYLGQQFIACTFLMWDTQAEGMPQHIVSPPISPVCYTLGIPQCTTRPPRVIELIGVFGCCCCCYCCVGWCATSLVRGSVRVALAVQHLAQHAALCYTAQHPCTLQHNATTGIIHIPSIVLAELGGQHCCNLGASWLETAIKV